MNLKLKGLMAGVVMLAGSALASPVSAAVPNLTVTTAGNSVYGNQVLVTVTNGNPYSPVTIYYRQTSSWYNLISNFGQTDSSGYFSQSMAYSTDGTSNPVQYYVVVGGVQSNTVNLYPNGNNNNNNNNNGGCYYTNGYYNCNNSAVTFSQNSVSMNIGQTISVNIYGSGSYVLGSTGTTSVVTAGISGSVLNLYAVGSGTSTVQVCPSGYSIGSSLCGNLTVTVYFNGNGNGSGNGTITFSQNSLNMSLGQSSVIQIYNTGSYGSAYVINNNSNPSVASTSLSGSSLTVYGSSVGNATLTVCNQNGYSSVSQCGSIYITVGGGSTSCYYVNGVYTCPNNCYNSGYNYNCGGQNANVLTFNTPNPTISVGQSAAIIIYGNGTTYNTYTYNNYQSYSVTGNSNSAVVSASTSGNSLNLVGLSSGTSVVSVCSLYGYAYPIVYNGINSNYNNYNNNNTNSTCGTLYVTVTGNQIAYQYNNGQVLGATTYANGTLVQEGPTIYIVYRGTIIPFGNYTAFAGLGYKLSSVVNIGYVTMPMSSYVISTSIATHPWGTWIKNGQTVYFVSEYGLIAVPDYSTFLSNGGSDANVVQANAYDFQLPLQSVMVAGDSRLR